MSNTTTSATPASIEALKAVMTEHRGWFIGLGIVLMILGVVAMTFPFLTTIATKIFLGWLFIIGGIAQIVHAFQTKQWSQFFINLVIGILYVLAGGWLAFFPLTGIITLTILLALMFILQGGLEVGMAFRLRPRDGWGWMLASGIVAALAGILILAGLPSTAIWAIGFLVGLNMITSGAAYLSMAMALRK